MHTAPLADQIAGVAILADPVRRSLYHYVVGRHADVGRDEAARAVQVSRALAAFHLDKLVGAGLLETSYRRLTKRLQSLGALLLEESLFPFELPQRSDGQQKALRDRLSLDEAAFERFHVGRSI